MILVSVQKHVTPPGVTEKILSGLDHNRGSRHPGMLLETELVSCGNSFAGHSRQMYFDFHCHLFTRRIISNVSAKSEMVKELKLNVVGASGCFEPQDLQESARAGNVTGCVILPSAPPEKVVSQNDRCYDASLKFDRIIPFFTLHPNMAGLENEIHRSQDKGIKGFKFSSFSQRFDLRSEEVSRMLEAVEKAGVKRDAPPIVVFDTFCRADEGFGADPEHLTTPSRLSEIYHRYPGINFVGAHMGGLMADFADMIKHLKPAPNFFLDTSNAAHTLKRSQFIELLKLHGPSNVLFGTDWPWFTPRDEIPLIRSLLQGAGYSDSDCKNVFLDNALRLLKMQ